MHLVIVSQLFENLALPMKLHSADPTSKIELFIGANSDFILDDKDMPINEILHLLNLQSFIILKLWLFNMTVSIC